MKEKASVLIVDDNTSLCETTSLILEHKGYAVTTAEDGLKAIAKVEERPFDIIFMDIKMPLMDGVETYKRIRKIRPEAMVVMMTAYAVEAQVQEALREGAHSIIYKPLEIEKMIALIEEAKGAKEEALILIVDDDPGICITLQDILTRKSCKVDIAHTGEEAIAKVQKESYDIIFIDIKLPAINGLETYLAIKDINSEAVAIMMTAYRQEMANLVIEALNNAAYACLDKPLDIEELLRLIREIRKRKQKVG